METELNVDETALTEFFGVLPEKQDPDEKDFFGSTNFIVTRAGLTLDISFSSHHKDLRLRLATEAGRDILTALIDEIVELRVRDKWLLVMTSQSEGREPKESARITLEPISVSINASKNTNGV